MNKEFRVVDKERGIVQITTVDERWYAFEGKDKVTGLPQYTFLPSVTWICEYYPKGVAFYKWLAGKGWDEAESLKVAAGDKGSKVHHAIGDLLEGKEVTIESAYADSAGLMQPLTIPEYEAVLSFVRWWQDVKPEPLQREFVVINKQQGYAGMVDFVCKLDGQLYLVDFKTSPNIWPSHELQVSAYRRAETRLPIDLAACKLAILQLGYYRNKHRYKFNEVDDKYDQFLAAKTIWLNETKGVEPQQKDLPLAVRLKPSTNGIDRAKTAATGKRIINSAKETKDAERK